MKILVAYFSRTNSTRALALNIKAELEKRGHQIDVEEVRPQEERGFWQWFILRIFKGDCDIIEPKIRDVSEYDAICIGSPNWTRLSLPMARYLKTISGLEFKNVFFFSTTAFWPWFEWYIFSAYLLDITFRRLVEKRRGRVREDIMISSLVKSTNIDSSYGKEKIKFLCDKIEKPLPFLKDFILNQREIQRARFLIIFFSFLLAISLLYHLFVGPLMFSNFEFWIFWLINFLTFTFLIFLTEKRSKIHFLKYFAAGFLVISLTVPHFTHFILSTPHSFEAEKITFSGMTVFYVLALILVSIWKDLKSIIFTGLISIIAYSVLFLLLLPRDVSPLFDIFVISLITAVITIIIGSMDRYYMALLENMNELEVKSVNLKKTTVELEREKGELQGLKENLEKIVKEKTFDLQKKVDELERFHDLTVGRELKMIELKKEIGKLKQG